MLEIWKCEPSVRQSLTDFCAKKQWSTTSQRYRDFGLPSVSAWLRAIGRFTRNRPAIVARAVWEAALPRRRVSIGMREDRYLTTYFNLIRFFFVLCFQRTKERSFLICCTLSRRMLAFKRTAAFSIVSLARCRPFSMRRWIMNSFRFQFPSASPRSTRVHSRACHSLCKMKTRRRNRSVIKSYVLGVLKNTLVPVWHWFKKVFVYLVKCYVLLALTPRFGAVFAFSIEQTFSFFWEIKIS